MTELLQAVEAARRQWVLDPVKVTRLHSFEQQQGKLRETLRSNARSAGECDQITAQIDAQAERLARLSSGEGAARAIPTPTPAPAAAVPAPPAAEAPPALAPPPAPPAPPPPVLSLSEPAPPPPSAGECNRVNLQNHADLVQRFALLMQDSRLPTERLGPYRVVGQRLTALDQPLAAAVSSDCARHATLISDASSEIDRLAALAASAPPPRLPDTALADMRGVMPAARAADPRAAACTADLRLSFRDVQQAALSLAANPSKAEAKAMLRRLVQNIMLQQVAMFGRETIGVEECQQLVQVVAELRGQVQSVRASLSVPVAQAETNALAQPQPSQPQRAQQQPMQPQAPVQSQPQPQQQPQQQQQQQPQQQFQAQRQAVAAQPVVQAALPPARPAGPDPRLEACREQVRRGQSDLMQQFQNTQRSGRITPQEFGEFQNINNRLNQMLSAVLNAGASVQDCQNTGQFIAQAQGAVQRMGQVDPRIESCKAQARQAYGEAQQLLQMAARNGRATPQKVQELQRAQGRLGQLGGAAQRDFGSLQECQNVNNALAQERSNLQTLAR